MQKISTATGNSTSIFKKLTGLMALALALAMTSCGGSEKPEEEFEAGFEPSPVRETEFEPAAETIAPPTVNIEQPPSTAMVVRVEDKILTEAELASQINRVMTQLTPGREMTEAQKQQARRNLRTRVIEDFVNHTLVKEEMEKRDILVTGEEIEKELKNLESQLPEGVTLDELLAQRGMSRDEMGEMVRSKLSLDKLIRQYAANGIEITEDEINSYYEKNKENLSLPETVHARHILISSAEDDSEAEKAAKKEKAAEIREKLAEGADFAEMAEKHSDCPTGQRSGGDLGTFPRERMVESFSNAAFSQETGDIGPVVGTKYGYHIIQVLEHNKPGLVPRDKVTARLNIQKREKLLSSMLSELKSRADIEYARDR
ncbi:MAG: peptidylprolyl isomerase [Kiritimatiellia bacterium]